jgi:membrane-associated protease RseP (regulator of RpoE activity)
LNVLVWIFGVVLFALAICVSVALHEAGHMLTAKAFGMKVRRYFIGFGPRIWSFRRGETEYGLKAIPLGGFCDIAGMTALDEVRPDEAPRAMWRYPVWKRMVVLGAGSVTHFILGFLILFLMTATMGLPDPRPAVGGMAECITDQDPKTGNTLPCTTSSPPSPAKQAGLRQGDVVLAVAGTPTPTWEDVLKQVRGRSGPTEFRIERDGQPQTLTVNVTSAQRLPVGTEPSENAGLEPAGVIGIGQGQGPNLQYNVLSAVPASIEFTGQMFAQVWQGLLKFPEKIPKVVEAIGGGERDPDTPVSVVGASIIGGDAVERGLWELFLFVLIALNFFVGVFNLLPLLPLDGGHMAITLYEKVRDWVRSLRGKPAGGPVDYTKLTAVTMVVVFLGGAVVLLTVTADLVNPIRLGQ